MNQLAFLFPGQGAQYPGMGRELCAQFSVARETLEEADHALGFSLSSLCFGGSAEQLQLTENTQPALLACSVAAFRILAQQGIGAAFVAGHSLGEYSALVAAGSLSFADALCIVRQRGRYMQEAVPVGTGAMAAILGMRLEQVEEMCRSAANGEVVAPANINTPQQIVVAGHGGAVTRVVERARKLGAKRVIILPVSAPFHCSLMQPAQQRLAPELEALPFRDPSVPLVNNVRTELVYTAEEARQGLIDQIPSPVLWERSMHRLLTLGVERFVEVGPGRVLSGLLRQMARAARAVNVEDPKSLEKALAALAESGPTPAGDS